MNTLSKAAKEKKKTAAKKKPVITKAERKEKYTQQAHDKSRLKHEKNSHKTTTCFNCREVGHAAVNCPKASTLKKKICFRCGSEEHRLDDCPKGSDRTGAGGSGDLPFAECFVCGEMGHLSGSCPNNEKGVYVNGGCCKICGGVDHVESRCPDDTEEVRWQRKQEKKAKSLLGPADVREGARGNDEEWDSEEEEEKEVVKGKRVVF